MYNDNVLTLSVVQQRREKRARKELMARIRDEDKGEEPKVVNDHVANMMLVTVFMSVLMIMAKMKKSTSRSMRRGRKDQQGEEERTGSRVAEWRNS